MAGLDKEVLKLQLKRLFLTYDWHKENQTRYSDFFTECAVIFPPDVRTELNAKIWALEQKYGSWKIYQLEFLILALTTWMWGKRLYLPSERGMKQREFLIADCMGDLNDLVLWCKLRLHQVAMRYDVDFSSAPMLPQEIGAVSNE